MQAPFIRSSQHVLLSLSVATLFCGCHPHPNPTRFPIRVELDPALADNSVQVDFVADAADQKGKWEQLNINEYWPNHPLRKDAKPITLLFGPNQDQVQTIKPNDPRYAEWLKKKPLIAVLIQDVPIQLPVSGPTDRRRAILSLDKNYWAKGTKELTVVIQESGIKVNTPRDPKYK